MKEGNLKPMYVAYYEKMKPVIKVPKSRKKEKGTSSYPKQVYFFELMFPEKIRGNDYKRVNNLSSLNTIISNQINKGEFRQSLIENLYNNSSNIKEIYDYTIKELEKYKNYSINSMLTICNTYKIKVPEDISSEHLKLLIYFLQKCVIEHDPLTTYMKQKKIQSAHLKDYLKEVVWKDGVSGKAGIRRILYLADRSLEEHTIKKNPFILYEAGEIEYYGRGRTHKPNYEKAYKYYSEAADNFQHPLALWSMGYIIMELTDKTESLQIHNNLTEKEKYEKALYFFNECLKQNPECGAAYNSLGKACQKESNKIPDTLKEKYIYQWGRTPIDLFKKAKKYGNVYGMNNYYVCLIQKSIRESAEQKKKTLAEAVSVIKEAADLLNPWSANRLAEIYFSGKVNGIEGIISPDKEMAKTYYEIAVYTHADDSC